MPDELPKEYILGIDLGSNSLGWAMIGLIDGEPAQLIRAGARVFEAGMEGDLQSGREESRNLRRRDARLHRRLLWRRRRRMTKLFNILQRSGLLPPFPVEAAAASGNGHRPPVPPDQIQDYFNELDRGILSSQWFKTKASSGLFPEPMHTMPYILRASALEERLEPHFFGRALYHLAQRRGFLSNRKQAAKKKDDDEGVVKKEIGELRSKMAAKGSRTLGEYFSRLGPSAGSEEQKIRRWHTHRDMFKDEFEKIWEAQAQHYPDLLTPGRKKEIFHAIFYQRPLWFDRNTIGRCELEPGERRAPRSSFVAQRFRLLQAVNNLRLELPDHSERNLTPEQRAKLLQELEIKGDRTFAQVRKLLNLKQARFTIEEGGEKSLRGNRTTAAFCAAFGQQRWLEEMSADEHERALQDVLSIQKEDALARRAVKHWKLDEESARKFAKVSPEPDHFNLSRKAIENLIPLLETGVTYAEARKQVYPESFETGEAIALLPPVEMALAEIRNPAVVRSLTELRKVVNAIIRQYGKPQEIYVELARDLKKSKKRRKTDAENMRSNERARLEATEEIIKADVGIKEPRPLDKRKYLLAVECKWTCPYTGKTITPRTLFGPEPQFDIEHIIPFSRSMDNSFQNLTLCYVPENRNVKGNKTPYEAYSNDEANYEAVLDRVGSFNGEYKSSKLARFRMDGEGLEKFLAEFRERQLNDTAYATRFAKSYLGSLYGGEIDREGNRRVFARSGRATSDFRALWKLNSILNDGPSSGGGQFEKKRADHRHHAIDAVVIGLSNDSMIQRLSHAAQAAADPERRRRLFGRLEAPWPNFTDTVRSEIGKIVVSHRVSKKVSGALHEESIYSPPKGERGEVRIRKPLSKLTKTEVNLIADQSVKKLVQEKLEELGGDPKNFPMPGEHEKFDSFPSLLAKDGRRIPIMRVRIKKPEKPTVIGAGRAKRHVISGNNHHVEIYAELDRNGNEKEWDGEVVPMLEASHRLKAGKPIVQRDHGPLVQFKFSLAKGDTVELGGEDGDATLWVVKKLGLQISLITVNDARRIEKYFSPRINGLRKRQARKVVVSPLGEVAEAHD